MTEKHVPFDNVNSEIFRVIGPPGCGKTTYLVDQAERAAEKYGCDAVRVVSMTKTASRAFAIRESRVPSENVTTLHALAYKAIGKPGVFGKDEIAAFNSENPGYEISGTFDIEDGPSSKTYGDALLSDLELSRSRCVTSRFGDSADFAEKYLGFLATTGRVDYTGMLERALADVDAAPGRPEVLFVDEAQDLSTLELRLVEKWASKCKVVVLVGDSDQSLYNWRGADRRVLMVEGEAPFSTLKQSFRVPRAVQEVAMNVIRRSTTWSKAEYAPKREGGNKGAVVEGAVARISDDLSRPNAAIDDLEREVMDNPLVEDAMMLAQCGYMLTELCKELRSRGIGYHNPYRGEWNPLARGGDKRTTGADRVLAFSRLSTARDWKIALLCLAGERSGGPLIHGSKQLIEVLPEDASMQAIVTLLPKVLLPGAFEMFEHGGSNTPASKTEMHNFFNACNKVSQASMQFPEAVYQRSGHKGVEEPKVVVGTIHSVKGGETEHVYLSTGLSPQARRQQEEHGWDGFDSICRTFYVGATRSKYRLAVCGSPTPKGVTI